MNKDVLVIRERLKDAVGIAHNLLYGQRNGSSYNMLKSTPVNTPEYMEAVNLLTAYKAVGEALMSHPTIKSCGFAVDTLDMIKDLASMPLPTVE